jgi:hypothetical protein
MQPTQYSRELLTLQTEDILNVRPDLKDKLTEELFNEIADALEDDFNENFEGRLRDNILIVEQDREDAALELRLSKIPREDAFTQKERDAELDQNTGSGTAADKGRRKGQRET